MFFGIGSLPAWLCGLPVIVGRCFLNKRNKRYFTDNIELSEQEREKIIERYKSYKQDKVECRIKKEIDKAAKRARRQQRRTYSSDRGVGIFCSIAIVFLVIYLVGLNFM